MTVVGDTETDGRAALRELAVAFMRRTATDRQRIIEDLLGPQHWADVTFAGEWARLLGEVRERGLIEQLRITVSL